MKTKKFLTAITLLLMISAMTLAAPFTGELDRSFNPTPDRTTSVRVRAIAVQPDGKFLIAGTFLKVNNVQVNHVARFNTDGTLDTSFDAGGTFSRNTFGDVVAIALQPDGKIIVSGFFDSVSRQIRRRIARLNADGSFDPSFNANIQTAAGAVTSVAVQPDGKILLYGASALPGRDFARLNSDGSVDTTFAASTSVVNSIAVQPDGKILIGGVSFTISSQTRSGAARINPDGSLDTTFVNQNVVGTVNKVLVLPNGKIFLGGGFNTVNALPFRRIVKLNTDGSVDASYANDVNRNVNVRQIAVQSDGKVVFSGTDTPIFRDNADGTPDANFAVRSRLITDVDTVAALLDDRIVAGGNTTTYNSNPPTLNNTRDQPLALLAADGTMDEQFNPDIVYADGLSNVDIEIQPDGKILFSDVPRANNMIPALPARHIIRYNADGSPDNSFTFPPTLLTSSTLVTQIARQADGKIVFGTSGSFDKLVVRLNADGSLDTTFNVTFNGSGAISNIEIQPSGQIIIFGTFTQINGQNRAGFARLNTDGSLDAFNPAFTDAQNNTVNLTGFKTHSDGKIYVSGVFEKVDGVTKRRVARFNADGSLDNGFTNTSTFFDFTPPNLLTVQPDGRLLGAFSGRIARFSLDGSLDGGFAEVSFRRNVNTVATPITAVVLANAKILIGGAFTSTSDFIPRFGFARLNADGTLDNSFGVNGGVSGSEGTVYKIALQPDGKALIAGRFQYVNGISQLTLARLNQSATGANPVSDFDGDGRTDAAVFRNGTWFINPSTAPSLSPNSFYGVQFGLATDKLAPADYDGDGKTDIAVWRESEGNFYILLSSNGAVRTENFGLAGDVLTVGDFDGDGKTDLSTYREGAQSYFFYRGSLNNPAGNITYIPWGTTGDKAVRGDFDGDAKLDAAIYRGANQTWYIRNSSNGQTTYTTFGLPTDKRVFGDFDGDGKTDICVFRDGVWYILQSSNNQIRYQTWGINSDTIAAGDYDGDGKTDVAVWRNGVYYILNSGNSSVGYQYFGTSGDQPVAAAFVR